MGKEDGIPRNRIILPKAPAFANTPLFTSGNPKLAFSLAITRSLLINLYALPRGGIVPIDHHLHPPAYNYKSSQNDEKEKVTGQGRVPGETVPRA